jgi:hypothetical protein
MEENHIQYVRFVSAKTGEGLDDLFQEFIPHVLSLTDDDPLLTIPLAKAVKRDGAESFCSC